MSPGPKNAHLYILFCPKGTAFWKTAMKSGLSTLLWAEGELQGADAHVSCQEELSGRSFELPPPSTASHILGGLMLWCR